MRINNPQNTLLLGLATAVSVLAASSCTYDYFVDESTLRVFVPQIVEGRIDNVLVSVHDASGAHMSSVFLESPFETYGSDGYIGLKIPPGGGYRVSCFADIDPDSRTVGLPFSESFVSEPLPATDGGLYSIGPDFRVLLFSDVTVYPLGYPAEESVLVADLDEGTARKAGVLCRFSGLPDWVSRIEIRYLVGTHMYYDGIYRRPSGGWVTASIDATGRTGDAFETPLVPVFPSSGTHFSDPAFDESVRERVDLSVDYYDSDGTLRAQTFPISTGSDIPAYDASGVPWDRMLDPRMTVRFEFKGFDVVGITLRDWDEVIEGGTTIF